MIEPYYAGVPAPDVGERRPIYVVLDNIRSAYNVGSIFRTSDAARVAHIYLVGISVWPPHPKLEKTSLGAHAYVPWSHHAEISEVFAELRSKSIPIIGLETADGAASMSGFAWPRPTAIVFGHEVSGILPDQLNGCDQLVRIPAAGVKNSLNVATAFGIVTYDILRTWDETGV